MGRYRRSLSITLAFLVALLLAPLVGTEPAPPADAAMQPAATPLFDAAGAHTDGITLRLTALGRGDALTPLAPVRPVDDGTRVQYRHGDVTEWYVRQAEGIEQGVTLAARPAGDGPLVLTVATPGAAPVVDADGAGATLLLPAAGGTTGWRYRDLHVTDATGQAVASHLEAAAGGLAIVVADVGAAYPLVVDPIVMGQTLTDPANTSSDEFGYGVAVSGDGSTLVVGAPFTSSNHGAAYIYTKSGGSYGSPITLSDPVGGSLDQFGHDVAVSKDGTTVVVGAYGTSSYRGVAYIYTKSDSSFPTSPSQTLNDPANAGNDYFGAAVALSGDDSTLVVGAYGTSSYRGVAYVYTKSGSSFPATPNQTLNDPANANGDFFGTAVAVSGDGTTLVVGASGTSSYRGDVYVYTKSGGSYGSPTTLNDPANASYDFFGGAVAVSGDGTTFVVGASGTSSNQGDAYVYTKSGGSFPTSPSQTLNDPANASNDSFGNAVALSAYGSTLIVGAPSTSSNQGLVYVYTKSGGSYSSPTTLNDPANTSLDKFGQAVAVSGDGTTLAIGAIGTSSGQGAAYQYLLPTAGSLAPLVSASPQTTTVGQPFPASLAVRVSDRSGTLLPGATVTFTAPAAGPSGAFAAGTGVSADGHTATVTGDASGMATAPAFTANIMAGSYSVNASVARDSGDAVTTSLALTNTAGAAASVSVVSGDHQSAVIGQALGASLVVLVKDAHNNPVPGATVTFAAPGGNVPSATFAGGGTATTDASGEASMTATAAGRPGTATITATVNGVSTAFTLTDIAAMTTLTLTGFSPASGPTTGGTTVTLHGTNFVSPATVTFGGGAATNVMVVNNTTITAVTPAAAGAGTVDISVTTGGQTATLHGYTYLSSYSVAPQPGGHPLPGGSIISPMVQPQRHDDTGGSGGSGVGPNAAVLPTATPLPAPNRH